MPARLTRFACHLEACQSSPWVGLPLLGGAKWQLCTDGCNTTTTWGLQRLALLGLPGSAREPMVHQLQAAGLLTCRSTTSRAQLACCVMQRTSEHLCVLVQGDHFQHSRLWCLL